MSEEKRSPGLGVGLMLVCAVLWSTAGLFIKSVPWNSMVLAGWRGLAATLTLWLFMRKMHYRVRIDMRTVLIGLCVSGTSILFLIANRLTTAANAIVLQFTAPVFLIFIMAIFFHEKPTRLDIATCVVVLAGIVCFFVDSLTSGGGLGNLLALLSGVTYAGVFMLNTFPGADSLSSILIGQIVSGVIGFPFLLQERDFSGPVLGAVFMLGFFQLGLAYIFFSRGLEAVPPVTASLTSGLEPVLNPVWVAIFYKETISPIALVGAVIVVGAIVCYNLKKAISLQKQPPAASEPLPAASAAADKTEKEELS